MYKNVKFKIIFIIGIIALFSWYAFPLEKRVNLGLDLKGGMHLVLRVDTSKLSADARRDVVDRAEEIIRNRVNEFGVGQPNIQRQGEDNIVVQLPGVTDRDRAVEIIGRTAQLEFKLVSIDAGKIRQALNGEVPDGYELKTLKRDDTQKEMPILVEKESVLSGEHVADAQVMFDRSGFGEPYVSLKFDAEGAKKFAQITEENVGVPLAIVLDGNVYSAPTIREPIPSGEGKISGRFSVEEASDLALVLRVGALPAPIYIEEERTIGPLLGQDSIRSGIRACIIGGGLVLIFMFVYYLIVGLIANFALVLNLILIIGTFGLLKVLMPQLQFTLTLPGIAGIVLTLGMAVDANVLINERIKEELRTGKPVATAIKNGYHKAFSAILDANLTTLIAAFFLFQFGTGPIRGFALTLTIGLIASMFTAIFVTRAILEFLVSFKILKRLHMLDLIRARQIDFIGKRKICYVISVVVICVGLFSFFSRGEKAYGIDFAGGQLQEYSFAKPISIEELRNSLRDEGVDEASIQQYKDDPRIVMIRTPDDSVEAVSKILDEKFADNKAQMLRIEKVGPVVGQLLRKRASWAIVWALIGILLWVGIRFKHFDFAFAGIAALFHDIFVTLGILALAGRQIDLLIVTALLTIAGYSINDTIVIYDRVRENMRIMHKSSLAEIINKSLNQTLARTVFTTVTTLLVVGALFFVGGEVLNGFAFSLMVGFVSGIYSTIYIASPLVLIWQKKRAHV
jgi:SecD/SecF fusion protein